MTQCIQQALPVPIQEHIISKIDVWICMSPLQTLQLSCVYPSLSYVQVLAWLPYYFKIVVSPTSRLKFRTQLVSENLLHRNKYYEIERNRNEKSHALTKPYEKPSYKRVRCDRASLDNMKCMT